MKKLIQFVFHRLFIVVLLLIIQIYIIFLMLNEFNQYYVYFDIITAFLAMLAVLSIVNDRSNPGYKIAWIILILVVPIFGVLFYMMFGGKELGRATQSRLQKIRLQSLNQMKQNRKVMEELKEENIDAYHQAKYIEDYGLTPIYNHSESLYFESGEKYFHQLVKELKQAKHYIFLEYFIIQEGIMWNTILEILKEKVKMGVDVRIIYDDLGCIMTLPYKYDKKLESYGIKCAIFNPFVPILSSRFNNRDHRKITVIDGHTAFTGGINLADEYINAYPKYGHWKDTGILIKGEAVWNFTVMFLTIWDSIKKENSSFNKYKAEVYQEKEIFNDGYIQPYMDSPFDNETVGESIYLNLINKAKKYIYITTPYLVIDNEMVTAICLAAKSGIDVKIITPHIPDKHYVHAVTRSYYNTLLESGVEIYEYTDGFIHAKSFLVDGLYGTVGTVNLDYRSLYLHFECGVWMYKTSSLKDLKKDFLKTLQISELVSIEKCRNRKWYHRFILAVMRIFAPLM